MLRGLHQVLRTAYGEGRRRRASFPHVTGFEPPHPTQVVAFSTRDRKYFERIEAEGLKGLEAARFGSASAQEHLLKARELLDAPHDSYICHALAEATLAAQEAYLEYKKQRYDKAEERLRAAQIANASISQIELDASLACHRIQLLDNLIRVQIRRGRPSEGLTISTIVLSSIEGGMSNGPLGLPWPWNLRWPCTNQIDESLAMMLHHQIARGAVSALRALSLFEAVKTHEIDRIVRTLLPDSQVAKWLRAQASNVVGSDEWLKAACLLLRHGPLPSSPMWNDVVRSTIRICREKYG